MTSTAESVNTDQLVSFASTTTFSSLTYTNISIYINITIQYFACIVTCSYDHPFLTDLVRVICLSPFGIPLPSFINSNVLITSFFTVHKREKCFEMANLAKLSFLKQNNLNLKLYRNIRGTRLDQC